MKLDSKNVRKNFPSLNNDCIFMDNAGGSQIAGPVVSRISDYLLNSNVQLGASYGISQLAGQRVNEAAVMIKEFINARDQSEIIIGPSTTMLLRILSISLGGTFVKDDEIIVTNCDHEANIGAWMDLRKRGVIIKIWKLNPNTFRLDIEDLKNLITPRTKLVAVTHTSNILGTLNPIKQIAEIVHENGALICVDGVAHAPHRLIDVQDLDADFYAFSFYKVFGPHIAMLYGKRDKLLSIPGVNHFFITEENIPYKFQPGSVNYELSYGILGIRDYFNSIAEDHNFIGDNFRQNAEFIYKLIAEHEEVLSSILLNYLNSKSGVKIIGEKSFNKIERVPTISFVVEGKQSDFITEKVDPHKIGIRCGDFYARRLIDDLGLSHSNGVVRISLVHYNTPEEIYKLIDVLDSVL
ncbi:MAG: aminotransferase class V-fold PLP-dependent enzyme [Bacteroidetes bacterium]|nr:aminotransferase class V-fold PLP-dependent enzyme [Bacteroidota bacterium]